MTDKKPTEDIVDVAPLLDRDPVELADSSEDLETVVAYLRQQRENISAAQAAGKKATAKTRKSKTTEPPKETNLAEILL